MSPETIQQLYAGDTEFQKLLSRRGDVDVVTAALELARDACPDLDFTATHRWIADRAEELSGPAVRAASAGEALAELSACLAGRHGLTGDAETFRRPEGSFLHRVIETRRGLPISLSLLYVAVGRRLGLDVSGVASPAHFLVSCGTTGEDVFVDPFHDGRILQRNEAIEWLRRLTGWTPAQIGRTLRPARPREIVVRMLNNLKRLYGHLEDWPAAWLVQQRLTALQPGAYAPLRDLGVIALRTRRPGRALDLLRDCLRRCPDEERRTLTALLDDARSQLAARN